MRIGGFLAVSALLLTASVARAESPSTARTVSLSLRTVPLRAAVAELTRSSGLKVQVAEDVPDVAVTARLQAVRPEAALRAIVRAAAGSAGGLALNRIGETYSVSREAAPAPAPVPAAAATSASSPLITLTMENVPLRRAAERLFLKARQKYDVQSDVPDVPVTVNVRELGLVPTLVLMVNSGASYEPRLCVAVVEGTYVFSVKPESFSTPVLRGDSIVQEVDENTVLARIQLKNEDARLTALNLGGQVFPSEEPPQIPPLTQLEPMVLGRIQGRRKITSRRPRGIRSAGSRRTRDRVRIPRDNNGRPIVGRPPARGGSTGGGGTGGGFVIPRAP